MKAMITVRRNYWTTDDTTPSTPPMFCRYHSGFLRYRSGSGFYLLYGQIEIYLKGRVTLYERIAFGTYKQLTDACFEKEEE